MSIVPEDADLEMQWTRWLNRRNTAARDHLIVHYSPLVKFVAGRVGAGLPSSVDPGDLVSSGVFGLIDAIERFDPERGVKFETFAVPRIRGAVYDGLRKLDWVPRSIRSRARSVEKAISELEHKLGRGPTDEEVAAVISYVRQSFGNNMPLVTADQVAKIRRQTEGRADFYMIEDIMKEHPIPGWETWGKSQGAADVFE